MLRGKAAHAVVDHCLAAADAAGAPRIVRIAGDMAYERVRAGFSDEELHAVRASTLLLVGGENLERLQPSIDRLSSLIPKLQVAVMPGQGHVAMDTAPEAFCAEVTAFLTSD